MNWARVALTAVAGGLSVAIAQLLVRHPRKRQAAYITVAITGFAVLSAFSGVFVLPYIDAWQREQEIVERLLENPAYREIRRSTPQTYERIRAIARDGVHKRQSEKTIAARLRPLIAQLVSDHIPRASDDAVVDFARVVVREIEELTRKNPILCYQLLFPNRYGSPNLWNHLGEATLQDHLAALAGLIRTAAPRSLPGPEEMRQKALLERVYAKVREKHGDDVLLLEDPHAPSVDKEKVCTVVAAIYRQILDMPGTQKGALLREMFSRQ